MPRKCGNEDAPVERSEANGFLPRMPDSLEQLDLLLIQVAKEREVRVKGISFQRLRYISTTLTTNATYRIVTTRAGDYTALNLPAGSLEFKFNGGSLLAKETLVLHSRFCWERIFLKVVVRFFAGFGTKFLMVHRLWTGRRGTTLGAAISIIVMAQAGYAQMVPPAPELAAKVLKLSGQVSVLHDSEPWALNVGDSVQVRQVIVTGPDGFAQFQVSDGSTFEVYPNSSMVFRKNPTNWRDLLDVFVGRVKIHIQKWGDQPNPNRIHTPTAVISVRGTTFDVSVDPNDETTLVSVEEGQVDVRHALKGGDAKILNAGESIHVYKTQPLASRMIDKGMVAKRALQALNDALYTMSTNGPRLPGRIPGTGGGGGGVSGQKIPLPPPPAPPPTPAPPPH